MIVISKGGIYMNEQRKWAVLLIRFAAIFGLIGTLVGSIMSGQMDYSLRPIHAHALLVGWLSAFAWGIFYYVVPIKKLILVKIHSLLGMVGAFGLTSGMYLYYVDGMGLPEGLRLVYFIVSGSILLIAFFVFMVNTFFIEKKQ